VLGAAVALAAAAVAPGVPSSARGAALGLSSALAVAVAGRAGLVLAAVACAAAAVPASTSIAVAAAAVTGGEVVERSRARGRELVRRSFTDRLTGLHNYDFFAEALRGELARVRRYGGRCTLVLVDLDRFKAYNDAHGHGAGNRLLEAVGAAVAREKRDADVAARFGGEEFAVLVPGSTEDGLVVAERIRRAIAHLSVGAAMGRGVGAAVSPVSASAGVATYPDHARDADELFERADQALYTAKRSGRDQTVAASEPARPLPLASSG
jgi:diguanylate cyclase (GGDEF)-like protein